MTEREANLFIKNISGQKPQDACSKYLKFKNVAQVTDVTISKPVQYYLTMIKIN